MAVAFLLALILGAATSCGGQAAPPADKLPATPVATAGRVQFENTCGMCHDKSGDGRPGQGPSLRTSRIVAGSPDLLIRIALEGVRPSGDGGQYALPMPSWRVLPDAELASILTYVRDTFGGRAPAVSVEDVARGRRAAAGDARALSSDDLRALASGRSMR